MNYLGIDIHKRESQVAIVDQDGEIQREVRVENANLDALAEEYVGQDGIYTLLANWNTSMANAKKQSGDRFRDALGLFRRDSGIDRCRCG